ncbi:MAG: Hydroxymethylglutaryl-CoA reductase [uncultured Solirubrobacterales bacterium]|uniref:hydroxymethylglutaryl-CoA reductase (NADPH) n=1 Tax=uncultured Solirubrobacterales bacterium TaxID=768556 RepID=A0A6J4T5V0_9ACTN|nr:MAG: Hydroxymethylglutaryl-CoA reductase [uncultured Solirubrobacterales bacterium]
MSTKIPRNEDDDYTRDAADARLEFLRERSEGELRHLGSYSFEPSETIGNVEHFTGAAQVPLGIAGPLQVNGEHAEGDFYVPMATAEGTLVASYNRGMKLTREAGGVTVTVIDDAMQRAPAFGFDSAREARDFSAWVEENTEAIREHAEASTTIGKLRNVEQYTASRFVYLRFNYTSGDAAGQNMTGKATAAACEWIRQSYEPVRYFQLEANFATDKKASQVNTLHTRGKRVVAEVTLPSEMVERHLNTRPELIYRARQVSNLGGLMSGVINNGSHSANALAAMFIATGQDAANIAESSTAMVYAELLPDGDYYHSITIPSMIVATYGGGTGLPTQRECLDLLGCYGKGRVRKLAEIMAATVLCGELSLGAAVVAEEWVDAHDRLGRNRP